MPINPPDPKISFEDWVAIHQLIGRYVDAVDRHDPELWGACWASEIVMNDGTTQSREQLIENVLKLWGNRNPAQPFRHWMTNLLFLEYTPERARMRTGVAWAQFEDGQFRILNHLGYDDILIVEDGVWRYQQRRMIPYQRVVNALPADQGGY
ncbi:MAG TPA: nuclear transport factor 2 family protein [Streptomyces sp.]|uniref:nuclear transport factor 2 family protein n=1 Tax=Streptomyces sp. TaxID=1931 RepID=UPI002C220A10|nr:nuclear transport factor 2 family protein [Streptomyces sp.]HWU05410.1 nuclear transport factor 2 family protein [Streptomyces sp.]